MKLVSNTQGLLEDCHSTHAPSQEDSYYDVSYDSGAKNLQIGAKVDSLKLWLMWKAMGDQGMQEHIDNLFDCARCANL